MLKATPQLILVIFETFERPDALSTSKVEAGSSSTALFHFTPKLLHLLIALTKTRLARSQSAGGIPEQVRTDLKTYLWEGTPMNSSELFVARSTKPALELISLATMAPELARRNLRSLLLVDPNYFGKITSNSFKAVLRIQQDTMYESIGYVGYSPCLEQLQATIHISESTGYSDADCISKEYARFYLSYDGGLSWLDQGLSSITVCNMRGPKPLQETLSVGLSPALTL